MPRAYHLARKGMGWPYVVGIIIGIIVLLVMLLIIFRGKGQISLVLGSLRNII